MLEDLLHGASCVHANGPGLGSTDSVLPLTISVPGVFAEAVIEVVCDIGAWNGKMRLETGRTSIL